MTSDAGLLRHDWYQTDQKVVINVLIKNVQNYTVDIQPKRVTLTADEHKCDFTLYHEVIPEKSTHRCSPVKVEITLAKTVGERWPTLIAPPDTAAKSGEADKIVKIFNHDWDSLEQQIKKEEEENKDNEGDALTNLFQKIYSGSTPEVRRAMNKSFSESGGTVLSTNWADIGDKTVEVKPPDGTEFKKWE